jgi:hypothetical protein
MMSRPMIGPHCYSTVVSGRIGISPGGGHPAEQSWAAVLPAWSQIVGGLLDVIFWVSLRRG